MISIINPDETDKIVWKKIGYTVHGIMALIFGIQMLCLGLAMMRYLKLSFEVFFNENFNLLFISVMILSIPLIAVGTLNIIRGDNKYSFDENLNGDDAHPASSTLYKDLTYVFGRLIPLFCQLSALIFGYIRTRTKQN